MNRKEGIAKLQKLYGKKAMYREAASALVGEKRAAVLAEIPGLRTESERLAELVKARRQAILAADPEYQSLLLASKTAQAAYDEAKPAHYHRRVTVGYSSGFGFHVEGEGDNWQEAIDAALARKASHAA